MNGPTGQELRDEALTRIDDHQRADTRLKALELLEQLARDRRHFTADDLLELCTREHLRFGDNRALGAVMRRAEKQLMIRATDNFVLSKNPKKHASPTRVWVSNIYSNYPDKDQNTLWN